MKIISHRGNLNGRIPNKENDPKYIEDAIYMGFDVETDVWYINDWYLGHDEPQYKVDMKWLQKFPLWCHCKNKEAFSLLLENEIHCFWHESDSYTLTSKSIPWCYPNNWIHDGITVVFGDNVIKVPNYILGVCVDNPLKWRISS